MRNLKKSLQILTLMVVTAVAVPVSPSWALAQTSEAAITPTEEVTTPSEEAITPTEEATTPTEEAITQQRNLVVQRNFEVKALGDIWAEGARERRAAGYADARKYISQQVYMQQLMNKL